MKQLQLVLLPGMDGTGKLFEPLLRILPKKIQAKAVAYPKSLKSFAQYVQFASHEISAAGDVLLVAESFSGPIAIAVMRNPPPNLRAIVLVATFAKPPRAFLRRLSVMVPAALIRAFTPAAIKLFCANGNAYEDVARRATDVVSHLPTEMLKDRVKLLNELPSDLMRVLEQSSLPILILQPAHDRLLPESSFLSVGMRSSAKVKKIAGPHFLLQCCPKECWSEIEAFLEKL